MSLPVHNLTVEAYRTEAKGWVASSSLPSTDRVLSVAALVIILAVATVERGTHNQRVMQELTETSARRVPKAMQCRLLTGAARDQLTRHRTPRGSIA